MGRATIFTPPAPTRHVYAMENGPDTVIATSPEEATEVWAAHTGEATSDFDDTWEVYEDGERLEVGFETPEDARDQLREAEKAGCDLQKAVVAVRVLGRDYLASGTDVKVVNRYLITAPAAWWAKMPAGFLCSTEW
jgi:hypothetical protein